MPCKWPVYSVQLEPELRTALYALSGKMNMQRSDVVRELIRREAERVGVLESEERTEVGKYESEPMAT